MASSTTFLYLKIYWLCDGNDFDFDFDFALVETRAKVFSPQTTEPAE